MLYHGKYKKVHHRDDLADAMTQDLGPSYERFRFFGLWLGGTPLSTKPSANNSIKKKPKDIFQTFAESKKLFFCNQCIRKFQEGIDY